MCTWCQILQLSINIHSCLFILYIIAEARNFKQNITLIILVPARELTPIKRYLGQIGILQDRAIWIPIPFFPSCYSIMPTFPVLDPKELK